MTKSPDEAQCPQVGDYVALVGRGGAQARPFGGGRAHN